MTDKPTTSAEMNIKEYAEQSYKGAALNAVEIAESLIEKNLHER